jgi:hypothetical protein
MEENKMALPAGHYKIGNRVYALDSSTVKKYTVSSDGETLGDLCGTWSDTEFVAHANTYDQNTESNYSAIKTALGL